MGRSDLTSVTIPNSVSSIGRRAFERWRDKCTFQA
ncbi:MAG: leucine-rich repeat domain-containing protein [Porphyromonadaceae bacterium]|nr:MAG: leucine-rich repeat domain-containing protein [Porphyromonadaceae bacterium]